MKIYIGTDHAGFELKNTLKDYLEELGHEVVDEGAHKYDPNDDYPDFVSLVGEGIQQNEGTMGIVLGGSGQGEAIEVNRLFGVRAIVFYGGDLEIIKLGREHNDANVLSLGARFIKEDEAKKAVDLFLNTKFSEEERHIRRITKLDN